MPSGGGFCRGKKDGKIDRVKAVMKLRRIWISCGALAPPGSLGSSFFGQQLDPQAGRDRSDRPHSIMPMR